MFNRLRQVLRVSPRAQWLRANRREVVDVAVRFLAQAATYGCIGSVIGTHVMSFVSCEGPSMLPTFQQSGDWLFAERLTAPNSFAARALARVGVKLRVGDVVWCRSPRDPSATVVKRIVALGGEEVPVAVHDMFGERVVMKAVPLGHVWLQGDNLADSTDSRDYGPVPCALVHGKVLLKIRPWESVSYVRNSTAFLTTGGHALHARLNAAAAGTGDAVIAVAAAAAAAGAGVGAAADPDRLLPDAAAGAVASARALVDAAAAVVVPSKSQSAHHHHRVALAQRTDASAKSASAASAPAATASSSSAAAADASAASPAGANASANANAKANGSAAGDGRNGRARPGASASVG